MVGELVNQKALLRLLSEKWANLGRDSYKVQPL